MEERLLKHSDSDQSLFADLEEVVSAPKKLLSHCVASRSKEDRAELQRILTHLPAIRESREKRQTGLDKGTLQNAMSPSGLGVNGMSLGSARGPAAPFGASPGATPQSARTPRGSVTPNAYAAPPGATAPIRGFSSVGSQGSSPRPLPGAAGMELGSRGGSTPRSGRSMRSARSGNNTPRVVGSAIMGGTSPQRTPPLAQEEILMDATEKAETQKAIAEVTKKARQLRGGASRVIEEEKVSQKEATQRVIEKLAEFGIDPEGMSATDILRIFYARGSGSSYWLMNREAEKRQNVRAETPRSFMGVLKPRAEREIRRARDLPVTHVHEYLDQWEIAFLGDICRSLRCFDEAAEGYTSEYMRMYTRRQYGAESGRKKFVRPPT